jgi:serine protease Do
MRRLTVLFLALALFAAACGSDSTTDAQPTGDTPDAPDTSEAAPTSAPTTAPTTEAASDFDISQVEQSVVQIQGQGTFVETDGSAFSTGFTGTGFIISDDGLVVTNNHVVQGAATLAVRIGGDDPINARILGVSECSDLAVIQLTGGGYTPLTFREDPVTVGIDVFAAGFPAADEADFDNLDYTLTSGIVSSTEASGETNWASVDGVLQHDARILGGNSGGPLVDEFGQVVGVNYAGSDQFDTNFAIAAAEAQVIIDQLAAGEDVDSLGINGEARLFDGGLSGIAIRSVKSGSPADIAGVEPGDILISLESLPMATDGTMSDYCDVLRTQGDDAPMDIEIYRPSLDLVLTGQVNGDPIVIPLITQTVIESSGGGDNGGNGGDGGSVIIDGSAGASPYTYTTVTDDQGLITVSIPTSWAEVDGSPNPDFGPSIWAAPNIEGWRTTWGVPGIIVESSPDLTSADIPALLEARDQSASCENLGSEPYDDGFYAGTLQVWGSCGGTDTFYVVLAASPLDPAQDFLVRLEVQAVEPRDLEAADEALATFIANV